MSKQALRVGYTTLLAYLACYGIHIAPLNRLPKAELQRWQDALSKHQDAPLQPCASFTIDFPMRDRLADKSPSMLLTAATIFYTAANATRNKTI